jgi:hypothetical protein
MVRHSEAGCQENSGDLSIVSNKRTISLGADYPMVASGRTIKRWRLGGSATRAKGEPIMNGTRVLAAIVVSVLGPVMHLGAEEKAIPQKTAAPPAVLTSGWMPPPLNASPDTPNLDTGHAIDSATTTPPGRWTDSISTAGYREVYLAGPWPTRPDLCTPGSACRVNCKQQPEANGPLSDGSQPAVKATTKPPGIWTDSISTAGYREVYLAAPWPTRPDDQSLLEDPAPIASEPTVVDRPRQLNGETQGGSDELSNSCWHARPSTH